MSLIVGEAQSRDNLPGTHRGVHLLNIQAGASLLCLGVGGWRSWPPGAPHGLCSLCRPHYICLEMLQTAQQHQAGLAPAERKEALGGEWRPVS